MVGLDSLFRANLQQLLVKLAVGARLESEELESIWSTTPHDSKCGSRRRGRSLIHGERAGLVTPSLRWHAVGLGRGSIRATEPFYLSVVRQTAPTLSPLVLRRGSTFGVVAGATPPPRLPPRSGCPTVSAGYRLVMTGNGQRLGPADADQLRLRGPQGSAVAVELQLENVSPRCVSMCCLAIRLWRPVRTRIGLVAPMESNVDVWTHGLKSKQLM